MYIFNLQKRHPERIAYTLLYFKIVAGVVQTYIKTLNQLLYPRVIEVCHLPFELRHDFFLHLIIVVELLLGFRSVVKTPCFTSSHNAVQKLISFLCVACEKLQRGTHPFCFVIVNILGTQRAHNFLYPNFSVTASWIVVIDTYGMIWCNSLIVTRRFARISPSISWSRSSEIKDGLPLLCSSWTIVLPSENSRHHFVTFCDS